LHSLLGAFEVREGQLSENKANYANEIRPFFVRPSIYEKILFILDFNVPYKIKFKIEKMIGRKAIPCIIFSNNKWKLQF
jgi:GTPase Era involved in 16S rRNA processing